MFSNCVQSYGLIQNSQSKFEVLRALHIDNKSCLKSTACNLVHRYHCCRGVATSVFRGVLKTVYSLPQQTPPKLVYLQTYLHSIISQKMKILHRHDCLSLLYILPSKWRTFFPHMNITNVPQHEHRSQQKLNGTPMGLQTVCLWAPRVHNLTVSCWFHCIEWFMLHAKSKSYIKQFYLFKGLCLRHITWDIWLWIGMAS